MKPNGTAHRAIALLLAGLAAAWATGVVLAEDPKLDPDPLLRRRENAKRKWADEHCDLGDFCRGKKIFRQAACEYEKALGRWSDHGGARSRLGYKKEGAAWISNPKAVVKRANEVTGEAEQKLLREYQERLAKLEKKAAEEHWQLGKAFVDAGRKPEGEDLCRVVLGYDSNHARARQALGYERVDGQWLNAEERAQRDQLNLALQQAGVGAEVTEESEAEKALDMKLSKRRSAHFLIQAYLDQERTGKLVQVAEATWAQFHALFGLEKPQLTPIEGLVLETRSQHELYVDKLCSRAPNDRALIRRLASDWTWRPLRFECYQESRDLRYASDLTVHDTSHLLFLTYMSAAGARLRGWLHEGTAYYFTARITGTALTYCLGGESGTGGPTRTFEDPREWKPAVKADVKQGGGPDLRTTLLVGLNSFDQPMAIQAWSVIEFLILKHKAEFVSFLGELNAGKEQEAALREATGWDYPALEREWKKHVMESY